MNKKRPNRASRNWNFTIFPYEDDNITEKANFLWPFFFEEDMRYMIYGREICPNSGKMHLQGYVQFKKQLSAKRAKEYFDESTHLEIVRIDNGCAPYCKKDGDYEEFGKIAKPGERVDVEEIVNDVIQYGYDYCAINHPTWVFNYDKRMRAVDNIRFIDKRRDNWYGIREVIWVYGETGKGKSKWVRSQDPKLDSVKYINQFFIGYTGNDVVLFDDFRPRTMPFDELLRITDIYDDTVNIKGGQLPWIPTRIYFTSIHHPKWMYHDTKEPIEQLIRRITRIIHINSDKEAIQEYPEISN